MHIPDGVLSVPVMLTTGVLAAGGVAKGLRQIDYERIPRVAVLASVFFVASLIHVPIGLTSSHLLLNGLMGILVGWSAFPALLIALLLQVVFFGFGGVTSLGANTLNMAIPAIAVYSLFACRIDHSSTYRRVFGLAFAAGVVAIALTCFIGSLTLFASGKEFAGAIVAIVLAHTPVAIIEGFVTGSVVVFLYKVRPELIKAPIVQSEYEIQTYA